MLAYLIEGVGKARDGGNMFSFIGVCVPVGILLYQSREASRMSTLLQCGFLVLFTAVTVFNDAVGAARNQRLLPTEKVMEVVYSTPTTKGFMVLIKDVDGVKLYNTNKLPPKSFVVVRDEFVSVSTGTAVNK